jgi:hypothetical protein
MDSSSNLKLPIADMGECITQGDVAGFCLALTPSLRTPQHSRMNLRFALFFRTK